MTDVERREEVVGIGQFAAPDVPPRRIPFGRVAKSVDRTFSASATDADFQLLRRVDGQGTESLAHDSLISSYQLLAVSQPVGGHC